MRSEQESPIPGCGAGLLLWLVIVTTLSPTLECHLGDSRLHLHLLVCSVNPQVGSPSARRVNKHLILSAELSSARKAGPGLGQTRAEVSQAWLCPHRVHRHTGGSFQHRGCVAGEEESGPPLGRTPMRVPVWSRKIQLVPEGHSLSPPCSPTSGPPRLWSCGNGCCPKCQLGGSPASGALYSTPPALNPGLGQRLRSLRPLQILACSCSVLQVGGPSSWLPELGGLPGGGVQEQEQNKAGSSRRSTGGFGECPGQR